MAELVGTISAVTSLVDFSGQIRSLGYGYLAKVVRAPSQVRTLMSKLANVNISLDRLRELADDNCCNSIPTEAIPV